MSIKLKDTILDYIDKAYKDGSGNIISSTYLPKSGGTIDGLLAISGNEYNDISTIYNSNGSITNIGSANPSIRHALSFKWYNTDWQIGNIRGGSDDSIGFGITKNNNICVFRVNDSGAWIKEQSIIHSGNIGSQSVNYASSAGSVAWSNVSGKPSTYSPSSHTHTKSQITDFPTSLPASDVYAWAKAANKPSYTYSEVGAPMHKYLFYKADYEHYVVLLCKIGTGTTGTNHRISGKIYTETGGGARYQAADIDVWRSDWSSGNDSYTKFNSYGLGEMWDLVTCKYGNSTYLAIRNRNIQACFAYFQGTATNIDFTAIKYYTSNTSTVNNSEINGSISVVSSFDRYAWKAEIPTKTSQLTNDSGYLTSLPSHTHTKSQITDFPTSLPANGGNSDTVDNKHASDFMACIEGSDFNPSDVIGNYVGMSTQTGITSNWTHIISLDWRGGGTTSISGGGNSSWETQLALPTQNRKGIYYRSFSSTAPYGWIGLIDSNNIGSQSVNYASSAGSVAWGNVSGKPSTFTPSDHTHSYLPFEQTVNSKDINTIKTTGFYYGYNMTNSAITGISSFIVAKYSPDWGTQIQLCSETSRSYIRYWRNSGGVMGNWYTLAYTSDIPTSLPANGGNADTVDNKHASDFAAASHSHSSYSLTSHNHNSTYAYVGGSNASGTWGINVTGSAGSVAWGNVSGKPSTFTPSSHTHSDYMVKSDPIGSGTLRMDGSNSRGSFPAVKLHISSVNWSQMLMNGSGELEFRGGSSQDAGYVTTRMGACCCTTLYINGEQITFVT